MEQPLVQLDYKLILEKLYEAPDEICSQIKEFTMEIKNRNSALNLQIDSQTLSEHSIDPKTTEAGLTKDKEESILFHMHADEISEELKRIAIKQLTTLKPTEMDRQAQRTENYGSLDKQLSSTKLDIIEPAIQQFQTWRFDFSKQGRS